MKPKIACIHAALSFASLFPTVSADPVTYCDGDANDICYAWGVPPSAASSGSGSIYLRIVASTRYQWAALGTGSRMSDSQMLIVYQDGTGNVTLSTRTARGHSMPEYHQTSSTKLLQGSGVSGSNMIASIELDLSGSSLDVSGANSWISAWRTGSTLDSSDTSVSIGQHDSYEGFSVDLSKATLAADANPFTNTSTAVSSPSNSAGSGVTSTGIVSSDSVVKAHGIVMAVAFLVGFPAGAFIMPVLGSWKIHAGWQMLVFVGIWIGFGLGKVSADKYSQWFNEPHVQLGTVVVTLMILQPVLGLWHHRNFVAYSKRTTASYLHIWYGRALVALGIINGGIGLQLTRAETPYTVGYIIICILGAVGYAAAMFWKMKRSSQYEKGLRLSIMNRD